MEKFEREDDVSWVKLYRRFIDSTVFDDPKIFYVWAWCLARANHKPTKVRLGKEDILLEPGQFITGRNKALQKLRGITARSYRTAMTYLVNTSRITIQSDHRRSKVSILKWSDYQNTLETTSQTTSQTQPTVGYTEQNVQHNTVVNVQVNDPRTTSQRPANDQPTTTDKNEKNGKNEKNEKKTVGLRGAEPLLIGEPTESAVGSAVPRNETGRRAASFPAEWYVRVIDAYQRLKGVRLNGPEFSPVQQEAKTMFMASRTPDEIISCMEFFADSDSEAYQSWTVRTVRLKLPEFLAGRLRI